MKITTTLKLTVAGLATLAVGSTFVLQAGINNAKDDARIVNYTGVVRGGAQRVTKLELGSRPSDELIKTVDQVVDGLINGSAELKLSAAKDPDFLAALEKVKADWVKYKASIMAFRKDPRLAVNLLNDSEEFYKTSDAALNAAVAYGEKDIAQLRILDWLILAFNLVALGFIAYIVQSISRTLTKSANIVSQSSEQIASTITQQEIQLSEQADSVRSTTATIEELGSASMQAAIRAENSASEAQKALSLSETGSDSVTRTIEGITDLRDRVEAIAEKIMQLSQQTNQIASVSDLVADIANQTNMLSLNAAVEAARAGEQGKGFAVVAGEVRKLADQSKKSAEKISILIAEVQSSINSTVMVTDEGTKTAAQGITLAINTAEAFAGIERAINAVFTNTQEISSSSKRQAITVQQAVAAINAINLGSQETASGVAQVKQATNDLVNTTNQLQGIV
jgi:methyl-accepting chemotaxis protein